MNQGNLAESFLKIAVYLIFPYLIPYKIMHVYLPEMSMRMTYQVRQEIPRVAHLCILKHTSYYISLRTYEVCLCVITETRQ